ncbi:MAG: hypothetical protein GF355_15205, partial [Candidatus Eisenbacteria bacterium]|nr:hypothetical protein [Candidatus Eisenbacteria bacterium]
MRRMALRASLTRFHLIPLAVLVGLVITSVVLVDAVTGDAGPLLQAKELELSAPAVRLTADGAWSRVHLATGMVEAAPGDPALPVVDVVFELPQGYRPQDVRLENTVWESAELDAPVIPFSGATPGGVGEAPAGEPRAAVYQGAALFPEDPVSLAGAAHAGGRNVARVQVRAVRFDPAGPALQWLRTATVVLEAGPGVAPAAPLERLRPTFAAPGARKEASGPRFVEPGFSPTMMPSLGGSPVAYVIVTTEDQASAWQTLADWKTATGTPAVVRDVDEILAAYPTGVDAAERLRNFIRDAYTYWDTQYVLLAGAPGAIPVRHARTWSYDQDDGTDIIADMYFACLDGSWNADGDGIFGEPIKEVINPMGDGADNGGALDFGVDVTVGRVPMASASEAEGFVAKYFDYVRTPARDGYLDNLLLIGEVLFEKGWRYGHCDDCDGCPPGTPCVTFDGVEQCEDVVLQVDQSGRELEFYRLYERHEFWSAHYANVSPTTSGATSSFIEDPGMNIIHHVGHGAIDRWAVGSDYRTRAEQKFTVNEAAQLANALDHHVTGLVYAINCNSAEIDYNCLGEAILANPDGGTVNYIGSTNLDFPSAATAFQNLFYQNLLQEDMPTVGAAYYDVMENIGAAFSDEDDNVRRFLLYSLIFLGEPQMQIWLDTPAELALDFPSSVSLGEDEVTITVNSGGSPVAGALVTVHKEGESYASDRTDAEGSVTLPLLAESTGEFQVTATANQKLAVQESGQVTAPDSPVLRVTDVAVLDDGTSQSAGNGNGRAEFGETVALTPTLLISGPESVEDVELELDWSETTWSDVVAVSDPVEFVAGPLSPGNHQVTGAFLVEIPR